MSENTDTAAPDAETFFDLNEVREAMASPEYRTSARYRDAVASKLARSQEAGTVGHIADRITPERRNHTTHAIALEDGTYGSAQPLPTAAPVPYMAVGTFKSLDEINAAMDADSYRDPTFRRAVSERIQRSLREGTLDERALAQVAVWQAEAEARAGL